MYTNELQHHGIKGMRWGVRKNIYTSSSLVSTQKRKKPMGTMDGDGWTPKFKKPMGTMDGDGWTPKFKKPIGSKSTVNKSATEDKNNTNKEKSAKRKQRAAKVVAKGAEVTSKLLLASAVDDVFYGGAGKKIAKEAVIQTGRAAITACIMARGGYDIKWYDKQGRRVG